MNNNNPRILLIDNYDSYTFNLVRILEEEALCTPDVVRNDMVSVEEAAGYDAFLFSPGPGVPSQVPSMNQLLLKYHTTKSFLGICLGHQAIAESFGSTIINLGTVYHGLKANIRILDSDEYLFANIPMKFEAGLYHSWAVSSNRLPGNLRVTAISDDGIIMALTHKYSDVKGVQFHPESYMTHWGRQIITNWVDHLRDKGVKRGRGLY